jgi:tRNA-dihydrouridine synthase
MITIYLAPMQGFTDYIYRKAYAETFVGLDAFYIPYVSVKNGQILPKYLKELDSENNPQETVIPQVLVKDVDEMLRLTEKIQEYGFSTINLNMGCPYPMVTNRERGAGLLPEPKTIDAILKAFYKHSKLHLSVKTRLGVLSPEEINQVIPVLNQYPLHEVILHARIAKQLYKGKINTNAFHYASCHLKHKLVYNGDIFTTHDFEQKSKQFPETTGFMLGRGILMNPFLPAEIKGIEYNKLEKKEILYRFQQNIQNAYTRSMDNPGNALNKIKQFWMYFSYNFAEPNRVWKSIKKLKKLEQVRSATEGFFY